MANLSSRPDSPGSSSEGKTDNPHTHTHKQSLFSSGPKHMADDSPFPIVTSSLPFCDQQSLASVLFNFIQNPDGARRQRRPYSHWTSSWGVNLASDRPWGTLSIPQALLLSSCASSMVGWKNWKICINAVWNLEINSFFLSSKLCCSESLSQGSPCGNDLMTHSRNVVPTWPELRSSSGNSVREPEKFFKLVSHSYRFCFVFFLSVSFSRLPPADGAVASERETRD